jgi:hypothetical protein
MPFGTSWAFGLPAARLHFSKNISLLLPLNWKLSQLLSLRLTCCVIRSLAWQPRHATGAASESHSGMLFIIAPHWQCISHHPFLKYKLPWLLVELLMVNHGKIVICLLSLQ